MGFTTNPVSLFSPVALLPAAPPSFPSFPTPPCPDPAAFGGAGAPGGLGGPGGFGGPGGGGGGPTVCWAGIGGGGGGPGIDREEKQAPREGPSSELPNF